MGGKFWKRKERRGAVMKHLDIKFSRGLFFLPVLIFIALFLGKEWGGSLEAMEQSQQEEVKKATIYRDIFPLITESDLYCSFFILDKDSKLDIKIIGAEKEGERILLKENDTIYINKGKNDGVETGQLFLIVDVGSKVSNPVTGKKYGRLVTKKGKAQIIAAGTNRSSARIEKTCGEVKEGYFLVPFEEKTGLLGKDLGYEDVPPEAEGLGGMLVYFQDDLVQAGSGRLAVIDLGEEDGIQFGQQLVILRISGQALIPRILGNLIVIDTQKKTSTVKILSCNDTLRIGDRVRTR